MHTIVKFGKYKCKPVSELKKDVQYCDWLRSTAKKDPDSMLAIFVKQHLCKKEPTRVIYLGALEFYSDDYVYPGIAEEHKEYMCPECRDPVVLYGKGFEHTYETDCSYYSKTSECTYMCKDGNLLLHKLKRDGVNVYRVGNCSECKESYRDELEDITKYHAYRLLQKAGGEIGREVRIDCYCNELCDSCVGMSRVKEKQLDKYIRYTLGQSVFSDFLYHECLVTGACACDYCMFSRSEYLQFDMNAGWNVERNRRIVMKFWEFFRDKIPVVHTRSGGVLVYIVDRREYGKRDYWDYIGLHRDNYPVLDSVLYESGSGVDTVCILKRVLKECIG